MKKISALLLFTISLNAYCASYGGAGTNYSNYTGGSGSGGFSTGAIILGLIGVAVGIYLYFKGE